MAASHVSYFRIDFELFGTGALLDFVVAELVGDDLDLLESLDTAEGVLRTRKTRLLAESPTSSRLHVKLLAGERGEILNSSAPTIARK